MAVIETRTSLNNKIPEHEPLDPVEEMLFGRPIEPQKLHPEIRNIYASTVQAYSRTAYAPILLCNRLSKRLLYMSSCRGNASAARKTT